MYGQVYTRGLRAYVPMHEGSNCCGKCLGNQTVSMLYDWKTCLALGGALKARSEEHNLVNAKWAWSEVRIGLGGPFGLVGRLRHRDRRRPRHGHRAVHQGQRRPPPGRCEVRQIRTGTRLFEPASQGRLGARACPAAAAGPGARGGTETRLNYYSSPVCVRPVDSCSRPCPPPAPACIVLPRAAPQSMRPREPREPDTAEDAGGQTDHLGQAL